MNVLISLRAEILKIKRTASWYLTIFAATIIPVVFVLDATVDGLTPATLKDPLNIFFTKGFQAFNLLILPMYIILICTLLPQVEYRNNTWKQVFAAPQTLTGIFFSKFLTLQFLLILFLVLYNLAMVIAAIAIHLINPALGMFSHGFDWGQVIAYNQKTYVAVAAISALQFIIGLRFRNFIAPIAIGFILWITSGILVFELHASFAILHPFSYPNMIMFSRFNEQFATVQWSSASYALALLALGCLAFHKRKIKV